METIIKWVDIFQQVEITFTGGYAVIAISSVLYVFVLFFLQLGASTLGLGKKTFKKIKEKMRPEKDIES